MTEGEAFTALYKTVAGWAVGVIGVLGTAIAVFFNRRQAKLEIRQELVEKALGKAITEEKFEIRLAQGDALRLAFHTENTKKLDHIALGVESIHAQAINIAGMNERLKAVEKRLEYLNDWKHLKVDPYVPKEVERHEERIKDLEGLTRSFERRQAKNEN